MPINMTDYKMILHDRVYNVLQIAPRFSDCAREEVPQVEFIDAVYIDEDGSIKVIHDEAQHFQFVRRKTEVQ